MPYRPAEAARIAGVSPSSVKNYVTRHPEHFSTGARPGPGQPRTFTPEDVRVLAYIAALTRQAVTHADIAARLASGELADFTWSAPPIAEARPQGPPTQPDQPGALVVFQQITNMLTGQLAEARSREDQLQARVADLERQLGQAEGALAELRRPFWRRWFGL